jgi:hypothetical protein
MDKHIASRENVTRMEKAPVLRLHNEVLACDHFQQRWLCFVLAKQVSHPSIEAKWKA